MSAWWHALQSAGNTWAHSRLALQGVALQGVEVEPSLQQAEAVMIWLCKDMQGGCDAGRDGHYPGEAADTVRGVQAGSMLQQAATGDLSRACSRLCQACRLTAWALQTVKATQSELHILAAGSRGHLVGSVG